MNHYLIDTNVVIDMLTDRIGSDEACAILDGAERGEYVLHLCSLSVTNIYYSLRKGKSINLWYNHSQCEGLSIV